MRLKSPYALQDREGSKKIVRKFLWLPLYFFDEKEKRWLETADIVYEVKKVDLGDLFKNYYWRWRKERFATEKDYQTLPFEKPYEDLWDMVAKRVSKPGFWLIMDSLALLLVFFSMKDGVSLLLMIKVIQAFALYTFKEDLV